MDELFGKENNEVTIYVQVRYLEKTLSEKNNYQKLIEQIHVYKKKNLYLLKREKNIALKNLNEIKELTQEIK